jgi:ferric-dicitrate binding protein FerR (iron transport regulator)
VVILKNGNTVQTKNATSNGAQIVYKTNQQTQTKIAYNYLTIPRGGQFFIKLSDGTKVWLNSESQLKFPVAFTDGETRQVELVYGEAYFDVSPSTKHRGAKFKVYNKSQEVEVVGTEFNIKAYKDETNVFTTLVEGKVNVTVDNKKQKLLPNQQLNLNINTNVSVLNTVDVYNEIAWKEGVFSFKRKSLEEIMVVLSRWYDLDVKFENPNLKKLGFNGTVGKDQKIEEILETIKSYGAIKEYKITNKTVILK